MHTVSAQAVLLAASADRHQVGWFMVAWFGFFFCLSLLAYIDFEAGLLRRAPQPWRLPSSLAFSKPPSPLPAVYQV